VTTVRTLPWRERFSFRIIAAFGLILLTTGAATYALLAGELRTQGVIDIQDRLNDDLELLMIRSRAVLKPGAGAAERQTIIDGGAASGIRITVVRLDGTVAADSAEDPAHMDNHGDRPEIAAAARTGRGASRRHSKTVGQDLIYVAKPVRDGARHVGYVRAAMPAWRGAERLAAVRNILGWTTAGAVGFGLLAATWLGSRVSRPLEALASAAEQAREGNLDVRLGAHGAGEVGRLGEAFEAMLAGLRASHERTSVAMRELQASERLAQQRKDAADAEREASALVVAEMSNAVSEFAAGRVERLPVREGDVGTLYRRFNRMTDELGAARAAATAERERLADAVRTLLAAIDRFAAGDLTVRVDAAADGEVGRLYLGFNRAVAAVARMLESVVASARYSSEAAARISASTEELAAAMKDQREAARHAAQSSAAAVAEVADNAARARAASEAAGANESYAGQGGAAMRDVVACMRGIAQTTHAARQQVQRLDAARREIGVVVELIEEIVKKTTLLAINSSIEAAHAGAHGTGFGVVAGEVKKLAEKTNVATRRIAAAARAMEAETSAVATHLEIAEKSVEDGVRTVAAADDALEKIVRSAEGVQTGMTAVLSACERQSQQGAAVDRRVRDVTEITAGSAEGIAEIARAASGLGAQTVELEELLGRFKLPEHALAPTA